MYKIFIFIIISIISIILGIFEKTKDENIHLKYYSDKNCLFNPEFCFEKDSNNGFNYNIINYEDKKKLNYKNKLNILIKPIIPNFIYKSRIDQIFALFAEFYKNLKNFSTVFLNSSFNILFAYGLLLISLIKILFFWFIIIEPYLLWLTINLKYIYLNLNYKIKIYILYGIISLILFYYLMNLGIIRWFIRFVSKCYNSFMKKLLKINKLVFNLFPYFISSLLYYLLIKTTSISIISIFIYFIILPFPSIYSIVIIIRYIYLPNIDLSVLNNCDENTLENIYEKKNYENKLKENSINEINVEKRKNKTDNEKIIKNNEKNAEIVEKKNKHVNEYNLRRNKTNEKKSKINACEQEINGKDKIDIYENSKFQNNKSFKIIMHNIKGNKFSYDVRFLLEYWLFIHILQFLNSLFFLSKHIMRIPSFYEYFILLILTLDLCEKLHEYIFFKNYKSSIVIRFLKKILVNGFDFILYFLFNIRIKNSDKKKKQNKGIRKKMNKKKEKETDDENENEENEDENENEIEDEDEDDLQYNERSSLLIKLSNHIKNNLKNNNSYKTIFTFLKSIINENILENSKIPLYLKILINLLMNIPQLILLILPSFILKIYFLYFYSLFPIIGTLKCLQKKNNSLHNKVYFICYFFFYKIASIITNHSLFQRLPFYNLYKLLITISIQTILKYTFESLKTKN